MEKVVINSHWIIHGKDQIGKEMTVDTKWLDSIKIEYTVKKEKK